VVAADESGAGRARTCDVGRRVVAKLGLREPCQTRPMLFDPCRRDRTCQRHLVLLSQGPAARAPDIHPAAGSWSWASRSRTLCNQPGQVGTTGRVLPAFDLLRGALLDLALPADMGWVRVSSPPFDTLLGERLRRSQPLRCCVEGTEVPLLVTSRASDAGSRLAIGRDGRLLRRPQLRPSRRG
jgi:hypothetical protein